MFHGSLEYHCGINLSNLFFLLLRSVNTGYMFDICIPLFVYIIHTLHWRHNDHDGVSNHKAHIRLLNRLFRRRSKRTSKLRVSGLCAGNSPGPVTSPHKGPVTRNMFPFDDVIMRSRIIFTNTKPEPNAAKGKHVHDPLDAWFYKQIWYELNHPSETWNIPGSNGGQNNTCWCLSLCFVKSNKSFVFNWLYTRRIVSYNPVSFHFFFGKCHLNNGCIFTQIHFIYHIFHISSYWTVVSQIAKFMWPTWGPPGSCRPQMGPMLAPWTLLSGIFRRMRLWLLYYLHNLTWVSTSCGQETII